MRKPGVRQSRVLRVLRAGGMASSFKLNLACARAAEIAAMSGFDCIWSDLEHTGNDLNTVQNQVWAAKPYDTDIMVRVSKGSYSDYIRPLELDAAGIMVPHVMDAGEAAAIARMTRFHPEGRRPVDGGNADGGYLFVDFPDYIRQSNSEKFIGIQIEDPEAMDNIEEIARVPGIDMLFFGPGDFSHGIGEPGKMNHPKVAEARRMVAETALRNGKFAGTVSAPGGLEEVYELGYRFVNVGSDVGALGKFCLEITREFEKIGKYKGAG